MNCDELIAVLSDYIDGTLDEATRQAAEEHLSTCHNCHLVLDTTQQTILLYREGGRQVIPMDHRQEMLARLQGMLKRQQDCPPEEESKRM